MVTQIDSFRSLLGRSPDPAALISLKAMALVDINQAFYAGVSGFFGHFSLYDLVCPDDRSALSSSWDRLRHGRPIQGLVIGLNLNSGLRKFELTVSDAGEGNALAIMKDVTYIKDRTRELYDLAHYDDLTGLPNRLLFRDRVKYGLEQTRREKRPAAFLFIDLDNFKPVNDEHGHSVGDEVLRTVAQRLTKVIRRSDTVCRLSGDEFLIFLPMLKDPLQAELIKRRIALDVCQEIKTSAGMVRVQASTGVSLYPQDGDNINDLLHRADQRMYETKAQKDGSLG